ncbi:hypothetical protein E2320_003442, partial [Naja naja]
VYGNLPLLFTPECWNGILPHPCQHPQAFDKVAMTACQVCGFSNPEVCPYVGYAFQKGMCGAAPYKKEEPPMTLDCGTPLYWGWDKVTTFSQLKPGWQGTCILGSHRNRLSCVSQNAPKQKKNSDSTIQIRIGEPTSCTQFDLAACLWGRKQELLYRCNGMEGVLCYRLGSKWGPQSRSPPLLAPRGVTTRHRTTVPALASYTTLKAPVKGARYQQANPFSYHGEDTCTPCITKAHIGRRVINTLVYHTQAPLGYEQINQSYQVNGTMYMLCHQEGQIICYHPETIIKVNISVWAGIEFESEAEPYVETAYETSH